MQLAERISGASQVHMTISYRPLAWWRESKFVYIQGRGIAKPGQFHWARLDNHAADCHLGGMTEYAKVKEIKVFREENGVTTPIPFNYETFRSEKDLTQNIVLRSGDIVDVP
jgi:hypothetical protein